MQLFQEVEGATVIVAKNGVWEPYPVYECDKFLFAKIGSARHGQYVRLEYDERTSMPKASYRMLTGPGIVRDKLGWPRLAHHIPLETAPSKRA